MKKIQREVKTYTDVFVSIDGKEFNTKASCREWEKSYKGTLEASWKLIKKVEINSCDMGLPWSNEEHECYMIKPKDFEEITFINAYIDGTTYNNGAKLTTDHIGKLVALNFGYDHDYCDVITVDGIIPDIANYIAKKSEQLKNLEEQ